MQPAPKRNSDSDFSQKAPEAVSCNKERDRLAATRGADHQIARTTRWTQIAIGASNHENRFAFLLLFCYNYPMRVIAGTAKGRTLKSRPKTTRPIMDRVKENLFNILGTDVIDATVLDLYAGAGSVGIEALSRGAKHATFVEFNEDALNTIRGQSANSPNCAPFDRVFARTFTVISKSRPPYPST